MKEFTEEELKKIAYENITIAKIKERYSVDDEYKLHRKAIMGGVYDEFTAYNAYVEQCKNEARLEVYGNDLFNNKSK